LKEKDIQTALSKKHTMHGCFELKLCKTKAIRLDSVKDHQVEALLAASSESGLYHKITDSLPVFGGNKHMRFTSKKPFDFVFLKNTPAYVVICFYVPRKKKRCLYIPIKRWVEFCAIHPRKSVREAELEEYAECEINL